MLKVGLTGNIGSGKTTVCNIFGVLGIPVFHADIEAKKLYLRHDVIEEIKANIGSDVLNDDNIDFKKLANQIFSDKVKLHKVNEIIHPKVYELAESWFSEQKGVPYIIHESAILFENNLQGRYDKVINVSANLNVRIARVSQRDNVDLKEIEARVRNQMSDEEKSGLSDYVIYNNEEDLLIPQVLQIHKMLAK